MNDEYTIVEALGYKYINGADIAIGVDSANIADDMPARVTMRDVVLVNLLRSSLKKINPWISEENLNKVVHDLTIINQALLIESNQWFYENLVKYMSYEQDLGKGRKSQTIKIIDFDNIENNEFLVVNQFKVNGPKQNIIPDIVIFINGLPLAVIECKSPYITNPLEAGINQLQRYQNMRIPEDKVGVSYQEIKVKSLKQRWGSCTSKGIINFNWRIIITPISIVDYVVAHELCHLIHHDHSKEFWSLMQRVIPDYLDRKEWLRVNGAMLNI